VASGGARGSRPRRVSLPGVSELLRPVARAPDAVPQRPASGRENHSQKITVYLSAAELLELERARVALRAFGIPADRGRIVREALAVLLADFDAEGERSLVARRLRSGDGMPAGSVNGNGAARGPGVNGARPAGAAGSPDGIASFPGAAVAAEQQAATEPE
jgi:hypothetical protein